MGKESWCIARTIGETGPAADNSQQLAFTEPWHEPMTLLSSLMVMAVPGGVLSSSLLR